MSFPHKTGSQFPASKLLCSNNLNLFLLFPLPRMGAAPCHFCVTSVSCLTFPVLQCPVNQFFVLNMDLKYFVCVCVHAQSCPTLCDLMDCSLPGSSVHEISQARIPEWVAISSSRVSSQLRELNFHLLHCQVDSLSL